jgi:hypothetical protein
MSKTSIQVEQKADSPTSQISEMNQKRARTIGKINYLFNNPDLTMEEKNKVVEDLEKILEYLKSTI